MTKENLWKNYSEEKKSKVFEFAEEYKKYLNLAKTEREFVVVTEKKLKKNGFVDIKTKETLSKLISHE